jgi:hypothetical protein
MTGWICPKCGSVYAPFVADCAACNGRLTQTVSYGSDTDLCPACHQHRTATPLTGCPSGSHYGAFSGALSFDSQLTNQATIGTGARA